MKIDFFEEYPTDDNLKNVKHITFNSLVYIASKNIEGYYFNRKKLKRYNPYISTGYWPILEKSYWISPFSYTKEILSLIKNINSLNDESKRQKVLLDLELPVINKRLFLLNIFNFIRNKRLIKNIFNIKSNIDYLTAEYPPYSYFISKLYEFLGISYSIKKYSHRKALMFYTSVLKNGKIKEINNYIKDIPSGSKKNYQIALGTIATGVFGNVKILSPEYLDKDLLFCKKNKMDDVVIFKLGELNKDYISVIEKYIDNSK